MPDSQPNLLQTIFNFIKILRLPQPVGCSSAFIAVPELLEIEFDAGSITMQSTMKVATSSRLWLRQAGELQRSAMAMSTAVKVDGGKNSSGIDQDAPGVNSAEREAFRDDMDKSYGGAYSERSADEGFGERYGESVKVTTEKKKSTTELQRGETAERDQKADAVVDVEYDITQGEHVAEKEVSRHSKT